MSRGVRHGRATLDGDPKVGHPDRRRVPRKSEVSSPPVPGLGIVCTEGPQDRGSADPLESLRLGSEDV